MSEDLVKRLRSGISRSDRLTVLGGKVHDPICLESADRIEALQAERDAAVMAEREACAALCDVVTQDHIGDIVRGIGDEIRARSNKEPEQ